MPDITSDLEGYWKLDEASGSTAADSSGNANDGSLSGGPTWVAGQIGGGLQFDGINDYVDISAVGDVVGAGADFTFSMRVNFASFFTSGTPIPACFGSYRELALAVGDNTTSYPRIGVRGNHTTLGWTTMLETPELSLATDYHLVVTFSTTGGWKLYLDNVEVDSDADTVGSFVSSSYFPVTSFGGAPVDDRFFEGVLDEVRIYSRALSDEDVEALYEYTGEPDITTGLVGHWPFDEGTGSTAADISGNANDATLGGGVGWVADGAEMEIFQQIETPSTGVSGSVLTASGLFIVGPDGLDGFNSFFDQQLNWKFGPAHQDAKVSGRDYAIFFEATSWLFGGTVEGRWCSPADAFVLDTLVHVAVTYDFSSAANVPKIYINGVEVTVTTVVTPTGTPPSGEGIYSSKWGFDGVVGKFRIYDRILTDADIEALYEEDTGTGGGGAEEGVGAATVAVSATATGAATKAAAGASAVSVVAAAVGNATKAAAGAATVSVAAAGIGTAITPAVGAATVSVTAAATATKTAAAAGSSNTNVDVAGVGAATKAAAGAAAVAVTATATATQTAAAAGASTISVAATAVATQIAAAVGSATITTAAAATGSAISAAAGASSVAVTAAAVATQTATAAGTANVAVTASGVGAATAAAVGAAAISVTAQASADQGAGVGSVAISVTAAATGNVIHAVFGLGTGTVAALAAGAARKDAAGAASGLVTATGVGAKISAAVGAATITTAAAGAYAEPGSDEGAGTAAVSVVAAGVGAATKAAAGAAAVTVLAVGSGSFYEIPVTPKGDVTASVSLWGRIRGGARSANQATSSVSGSGSIKGRAS